MRSESGVQESKGKYRKGKVVGRGWSWGGGERMAPGSRQWLCSDFMEREEVGKGLHSQSGTERGGRGGLSFLSREERRGGSGAVCVVQKYHCRERSQIERRGLEVPRGSCPSHRDSSERVG